MRDAWSSLLNGTQLAGECGWCNLLGIQHYLLSSFLHMHAHQLERTVPLISSVPANVFSIFGRCTFIQIHRSIVTLSRGSNLYIHLDVLQASPRRHVGFLESVSTLKSFDTRL